MAARPPAPAAAAPRPPAPGAAAPRPAAPGAPAPPAAAAPAPGAAVPAVACPYTAEPGFVVFKLPTKFRDDEVQKIQIKNPTMSRVTFKVGGTKIGKFMCVPMFGFVEPMALSEKIELQPKKIDVGGLVSYEDKFIFEIGAAPADALDAETIWKPGNPALPKGPAVIPVEIKVPETV